MWIGTVHIIDWFDNKASNSAHFLYAPFFVKKCHALQFDVVLTHLAQLSMCEYCRNLGSRNGDRFSAFHVFISDLAKAVCTLRLAIAQLSLLAMHAGLHILLFFDRSAVPQL